MFKDILFQEEKLDDILEEIKPILDVHWEEIALNRDKIKLNPDYDKYRELNNNGMVKIFTARDDGKMVGYFVVTINHHLHYKDHKFAINDIIYLKKELRALGIGKTLIQFVEGKLAEDGVSVLTINTKIHQPFDGLMENLGYSCIERIYSKYIGE